LWRLLWCSDPFFDNDNWNLKLRIRRSLTLIIILHFDQRLLLRNIVICYQLAYLALLSCKLSTWISGLRYLRSAIGNVSTICVQTKLLLGLVGCSFDVKIDGRLLLPIWMLFEASIRTLISHYTLTFEAVNLGAKLSAHVPIPLSFFLSCLRLCIINCTISSSCCIL
jgi:hypothetical protein